MTDYKDVRTTEYEQGRERRVTTAISIQMIWLLLGLLEAVIALRVVFKLLAVNAANPFAALVYNVTNIFVAPFASLMSAPESGGRVLEVSSIIAMFVYLLIAWAIARVVYVLFYRSPGPVSVRQTIVADHIPLPAPLGVSQTITTDRTTTEVPLVTKGLLP